MDSRPLCHMFKNCRNYVVTSCDMLVLSVIASKLNSKDIWIMNEIPNCWVLGQPGWVASPWQQVSTLLKCPAGHLQAENLRQVQALTLHRDLCEGISLPWQNIIKKCPPFTSRMWPRWSWRRSRPSRRIRYSSEFHWTVFSRCELKWENWLNVMKKIDVTQPSTLHPVFGLSSCSGRETPYSLLFGFAVRGLRSVSWPQTWTGFTLPPAAALSATW